MTAEFKDKLKQFIEDYGAEAVLDKDICEENLEKYLSDYQLALKVLLLAQKEGIPQELLKNEEQDLSVLYQKMYQKFDAMTGLGKKHGILYGFARVSVRTWAYALGVSLPDEEQ